LEGNIMTNRIFLAALLTLALTVSARAEVGNPNPKSIDVIRFGPDGLLLIADSKGAEIITVETGDIRETNWSKTEIANIDEALAGKLGLMTKDIQIQKIAVNPASRNLYVAVRSMKAKQDVILTIDGAGKIAEFSLEKVKYNRYPLKTEKGVTKITDVVWAGGKIIAAAQASDTFASRVFTITPGTTTDASCIATETFHVGHNQWETKAPILTIMPYEENGKSYIVGSFTCTPIVKYALEDMQANAKVKGQSVVELGTGNTPRSMFSYEKNGKKYILVSTLRKMHAKNPVGPNAYWVARVDYDLLAENKNINENALWRVAKNGKASESKTDRAIVAKEYFGVQFMDKLDGDRALVLREEKGALSLRLLPLP
jgi:hypothetical protein